MYLYHCIGKFYLVDLGYPNRSGYLMSYKGPNIIYLNINKDPGGIQLYSFITSKCHRTFFWSFKDEVVDFIGLTKLSNGKANTHF